MSENILYSLHCGKLSSMFEFYDEMKVYGIDSGNLIGFIMILKNIQQ